MAKITKDTEKTIEKNMEYIGLNLDKLPTFLKQHESLNFRPSKSYDDTIYKVYKYVNIKEIEILISPSDRLMDLKERYSLSSPIVEYLDSNKEENIEKFANFLKMITTLKEDRIEEIAKEQEELNEKIPYEVKYPNNFIWQIYYSDYAKKYFMLVPTNEQDNNALFYLLKEQIANVRARKGKFIFVPISHLEYSGAFLTKSEIADVENYLWFFTKEWPNVYEVYDKQGNMFIKIVGTANVYEKMKSIYSISLETKEEALEFYKLLKAMFILATGAKEEYHFTLKINEEGEVEFWNENTKIEYANLSEYIRLEYLDKIDTLKQEEKEQKELKRKLDKFKSIIEDMTQEYLLRQKQIATFLECKKTFFGRVKYFFKKKKDDKIEPRPIRRQEREEKPKEDTLEELFALKNQYTIEDLINICTKLEEVRKTNTNLNLDIKAMETKKERKFGDSIFREGDRIMQIKNNYDIYWEKKEPRFEYGSGVFNGEFGTICNIDEESKQVKIKFDDDKEVWYQFAELDQIEHAYAITVHKAQGSEFDVVLMPISQTAPMLLTRNLLYTGMTRARKLLIIIGNKNIIDFMINNADNKKRNTGLAFKLRSGI